jgi:hypothetical protein
MTIRRSPPARQAAVCSNINLFMEMNEEEFAKFLQTFVTDVWHLLTSVSGRAGQDGLAMAATRFLTTVARSVHHGLFAAEGVLKQICESIVLPNLRVRGAGAGWARAAPGCMAPVPTVKQRGVRRADVWALEGTTLTPPCPPRPAPLHPPLPTSPPGPRGR